MRGTVAFRMVRVSLVALVVSAMVPSVSWGDDIIIPGLTGTTATALTGPQSLLELQAAQSALVGTAYTITRSQVSTTNNALSSYLQSVARDLGLSLESAGGRAEGGPTGPAHSFLPSDPSLPFVGTSHFGLSAGSAGHRLGFWVDGTGSYLRNDSSRAKNEGYGMSVLVGVDYTFAVGLIVGFDAGYVRNDLDVRAINGNTVVDGAQFGPYLSYTFNRHFSIDGSFSYGRLTNSTTGFNSFDINRYTGAINLNGYAWLGGFSLTGVVGYVTSRDEPETSSVPTSRYAAVRFGGNVGYPIGNFEPYIPLIADVQTTDPKDGTSRAGLTVGAGLRYRFNDSISAGGQVTAEAARSNSTNVVGDINVRIAW